MKWKRGQLYILQSHSNHAIFNYIIVLFDLNLMMVMRVIVITFDGEMYKIITWPFCGHIIISTINVSYTLAFSSRFYNRQTYNGRRSYYGKLNARVLKRVWKKMREKLRGISVESTTLQLWLCVYNVIIQNHMVFFPLIFVERKKWKRCKPYRLHWTNANSWRCSLSRTLFVRWLV